MVLSPLSNQQSENEDEDDVPGVFPPSLTILSHILMAAILGKHYVQVYGAAWTLPFASLEDCPTPIIRHPRIMSPPSFPLDTAQVHVTLYCEDTASHSFLLRDSSLRCTCSASSTVRLLRT